MGAEVKGGLLVHLSNYARERQGEAAWQAVVDGLPGGDREALGGLILASGWYPMGLWNRTLTAYMRAHAGSLEREAEDLARYTADHDLNVVFRVFLKTRDPAFMLKRATSFWRRYYTTGDSRSQGGREAPVARDPHRAHRRGRGPLRDLPATRAPAPGCATR